MNDVSAQIKRLENDSDIEVEMINMTGDNTAMNYDNRLQVCKNIGDLEAKYRIQEGLIDFPKSTAHIYSAQLSMAADRPDEALESIINHLR